jgi:L-alanine-DL-glutamate epimerase-like enolase superfamily enzyme
MTGETLESMTAAIRYLACFLKGMDPSDLSAIDREVAWRLYGNHAAKSALDMALLDLIGRTIGKSVHTLLGPQVRDRVPLLWLIGTGTTEGDIAEALLKNAEGITAFKVKIGADDAQSDARRTRAISESLGQDVLISADANQGYSVEDAIAYVRAVEHSNIEFVEQPVAGDDLDGMARVAAASGVAIGADEGIHTLHDIERHHSAHAAEGGSLKTIKLGGLRAVYRAGALCHRLGFRVNLACKIAESSIAGSAILHLAATLPAIDWGVSLSHLYLAQDLVKTRPRIVQGQAQVPQGPGLGIEVDWDAVREFRID